MNNYQINYQTHHSRGLLGPFEEHVVTFTNSASHVAFEAAVDPSHLKAVPYCIQEFPVHLQISVTPVVGVPSSACGVDEVFLDPII